MKGNINILIPDGDSTWALSVLQCLSHVDGYSIFVISNTKRTATKYSKYTTHYSYYERSDDSNWVAIINSEIEKHDISIVLPIAEQEILFFIRNKQQISSASKIIPLPSLKDFEIAIDKRQLGDFAKTHNIPHPNSFYITPETDKRQVLSQMHFPVLIKPLSAKGGEGINKINSRDEFQNYLEMASDALYVQEYIEGYDIDCSVLCLEGEILSYTIQKGNLKGKHDFAPQLAFDFLNNEAVYDVAKLTMSKLNWSGVAHLDMRYDTNTSDYKLLEINARFWGSIEGSLFAGINFPNKVVRLALNQDVINKEFEDFHYMRLKGVLKSIIKNPLFIFKKDYLMNNTEAKTFLKDPLPTLYKFREWLGRRF
jgi:predicted ATP-grasp superfamily ATP-dependent carboligase